MIQKPDLSDENSLKVNKWLVLANITIGTFMATLDGSIANVALPTIARELHISINISQWVVSAYLLTICATLPIMGKISDSLGRTRVYHYGFLLFAIGSAMCGLSGSFASLVCARILQALGASCLMSSSQGIIAETFAAGGRGRALGINSTMVSIGALCGPGIGGILVERLHWPSIFWINVPIGILAFIVGFFLLPRDRKRLEKEPFDIVGSGLFIVGAIAFLYVLSNGQTWGWKSTSTIAGGVLALLLLTGFYWWEKRTRHPLLDFTIYRIRTFAIGNLTALLNFTSMFFVSIMMPFYMQNVLGYNAELSGYTMMVYPFTMALISPVSGWLSDRIGSRLLTTLGLVLNTAGFALLGTLSAAATPLTIGLHLCLFGLGGGLFQSPNNASVLEAVPPAKLGIAGSLNALVRNIGMVLGTSLSVSLYSSRLSHLSAPGTTPAAAAMLSSLHTVFWTAMGISLLALLLSSRRLTVKNTSHSAG